MHRKVISRYPCSMHAYRNTKVATAEAAARQVKCKNVACENIEPLNQLNLLYHMIDSTNMCVCVCPPACPSVCLCEHTVEFRSLHVPLISDYVALLLMEEILHRLKWRTIICKVIFSAAKFLPSTALGTPLRFF